MRIGLIGIVALTLLAAAACGGGQSSADKAKSQACDASSDIQAQIDTLKGLPLSSDSVDKAKAALQKINADLDTIASAAPTVKGDLGSQLKAANAAFKTQVQQIADSITSAQSLTAAATALASAGSTLGNAYNKAFANVQC
ncbi:MAG TPA: hypothetical protein VM684_08465 [Gaiellales bacterium]|jgi:hypothetical protein|nr:hypothetical protein [Gaiellales bacterium]